MLSELLQPYNYVVQRNWDTLSGLDPEHPDVDLYVCEEQANDLRLALREYPWIDVRSPVDHYYPIDIENILLVGRRNFDGFWIPSPKAAFLALYYHAVVHKEHNKYEKQLKRLFLDWIPPVKCTDPGVGYYVDNSNE